jgi:hypothetical protein
MPPKKKKPVWTEDERAAMKEYARESRGAARGEEKDGGAAVLAKLGTMSPGDRSLGTRIHALVMAAAPTLAPRLWYGMPAYAKAGKILCFFQGADKFKTRYATLGFSDQAALDDGALWPVAFALKALGPAEASRVTALVKKAVG